MLLMHSFLTLHLHILGGVAQSVVKLIVDPGVLSSIPVPYFCGA